MNRRERNKRRKKKTKTSSKSAWNQRKRKAGRKIGVGWKPTRKKKVERWENGRWKRGKRRGQESRQENGRKRRRKKTRKTKTKEKEEEKHKERTTERRTLVGDEERPFALCATARLVGARERRWTGGGGRRVNRWTHVEGAGWRRRWRQRRRWRRQPTVVRVRWRAAPCASTCGSPR